jgi:hypothetical protein
MSGCRVGNTVATRATGGGAVPIGGQVSGDGGYQAEDLTWLPKAVVADAPAGVCPTVRSPSSTPET